MDKINADWSDWRNVENAIRAFIEKHGSFPKNREIRRDFSGLASALTRHHGGLRVVASKMGYQVKRKEDHYYEDDEKILDETRRVMTENNLDNVPSKRQLEKIGESGLSRAITLYGGFRKLRNEMGEEKIIAKAGAWKDEEYVIGRARSVMAEQGYEVLPSQSVLRDLGHLDLVRAIQKFHNGFYDFRKLIGEDPERKKHGTWKNLDHCVQTVIDLINEDGLDYVPAGDYLGQKGYNGLVSSIAQNHGGMHEFRSLVEERLGFPSREEQLEVLLENYVSGNRD